MPMKTKAPTETKTMQTIIAYDPTRQILRMMPIGGKSSRQTMGWWGLGPVSVWTLPSPRGIGVTAVLVRASSGRRHR